MLQIHDNPPPPNQEPPVAGDQVTRGGWPGVIDELRPHRGPASFLSALGLVGLVSAVFHVGVFLLDTTAWAGPVSWRKPIVFALSMGMLAWAMGWLLDRLPDRPRLAWGIAGTYAVSTVLEVGLITAQAWRGEASHFNQSSGTNTVVWSLMGLSVVVISASILAVFIWSLIQRPSDEATRIAALAGFLLIVTGLGIGQWLITLGTDYVSRFDEVPNAVISGEAGAPKYPHAVAFHGIQVFALAAAMTKAARLSARSARRLLLVVTVSYTGLLVASVAHTLAGLAPGDLTGVTTAATAACGVVLAAALAVAARRVAGSGSNAAPARDRLTAGIRR